MILEQSRLEKIWLEFMAMILMVAFLPYWREAVSSRLFARAAGVQDGVKPCSSILDEK